MSHITRADLASMGYCHRGVRAFCIQHNLSWSRLISEGLPVAEVSEISDPHAQRIVQFVRERDGFKETDNRV